MDEILREYRPWLQKVAGNLIGFDSPDLQDLVQEGYIAMWRGFQTNNPTRGAPLDYWLKLNALHRMKTVARSRTFTAMPGTHKPGQRIARDIPAGASYELDVLAAPDLIESVEIAYHHGEINAAISRLTPQQRRYVIARFWLGLSGKEMRDLEVFGYLPDALWTSKRNGARWKLRESLAHLAPQSGNMLSR